MVRDASLANLLHLVRNSPEDGFRVYFQDFDGDVRKARYSNGFQAGNSNSIILVCHDARFYTPLAVGGSSILD